MNPDQQATTPPNQTPAPQTLAPQTQGAPSQAAPAPATPAAQQPAPSSAPPVPAASGLPQPDAAAPGLATPAARDMTGAITGVPEHDLSPLTLFLQADPVVQGVMVLLAIASIACWTVIIEKIGALRRLRRETRELAAAAASGERFPTTLPERPDLTTAALRSGISEWRVGQGARETDGEYRGRLEGGMRKAVANALKPSASGLQLLATTGSVAPFVGLFGTVWGIMNSFSGIAASNDTSLAVVAPGIAEALFATAMGLVAAIPAVIAYNRLAASLSGVRQEALGAASELAQRLSRASAAAPAAETPRAQRMHSAAE